MIRGLVITLCSLGLAAVWGTAAFLKALDPAAFAGQITAHKITPESWSLVLAYFFVAVETLLALAHLAHFRLRLAFSGSALLLLFFIGVTGWAWSQGNTEGCGCFGRLAARPPIEVILEDTAFLAAAVLGFLLLRDWKEPRTAQAVFAVLSPLIVVLPATGPRLPFDSLITTLNPGEDMSTLAADDLPGPLDDGLVLLTFINDPCEPCVEGLPRLEKIAGTEGAPQVVAVFAGTRREARAWSLTHVPPFGVASAPEKVLRQYYRSLPQTALLKDGIILTVWRNRIPGWDEVSAALPAGADSTSAAEATPGS